MQLSPRNDAGLPRGQCAVIATVVKVVRLDQKAINTVNDYMGPCMRLNEIDGTDAAGQRVKMMRDNARRAKEQADRLKDRADTEADVLKKRKATEVQRQVRRASVDPLPV